MSIFASLNYRVRFDEHFTLHVSEYIIQPLQHIVTPGCNGNDTGKSVFRTSI